MTGAATRVLKGTLSGLPEVLFLNMAAAPLNLKKKKVSLFTQVPKAAKESEAVQKCHEKHRSEDACISPKCSAFFTKYLGK